MACLLEEHELDLEPYELVTEEESLGNSLIARMSVSHGGREKGLGRGIMKELHEKRSHGYRVMVVSHWMVVCMGNKSHRNKSRLYVVDRIVFFFFRLLSSNR